MPSKTITQVGLLVRKVPLTSVDVPVVLVTQNSIHCEAFLVREYFKNGCMILEVPMHSLALFQPLSLQRLWVPLQPGVSFTS